MSHYEINKAYQEMKKGCEKLPKPTQKHTSKFGKVLVAETKPSFRDAMLKYLKQC